jgi:hypothetical protein
MKSAMAAVHWTDRQRIGFADIDQDRRIKFSSMIRFVGAGYTGLFSRLRRSIVLTTSPPTV